jgi:hypothetical protein
MTRSDNTPAIGQVSYPCDGTSGRVFVYTGFPVASATVIPVNLSVGRLFVDSLDAYQKDGFYVTYDGIEEGLGTIEFSFQAA